MNKFYFVLLLSICFCSCADITQDKLNVVCRNDSLLVQTLSDKPYSLKVYVLDSLVYNQDSLSGEYTESLIWFLKKYNSPYKMALYATKNNNNSVPIRIVTREMDEKELLFRLYPYFDDTSTSFIDGECARLTPEFLKSNKNIETKIQLIRDGEHFSDSQFENFCGLLNFLHKNEKKRYVPERNIPILKSFSNKLYSVTTDIDADYYVLFAAVEDEKFQSSKREIQNFVENLIVEDFKDASKDVKNPLHCFHNAKSNGIKCIYLIAINNDWNYSCTPLGIVAIDNLAPNLSREPDHFALDSYFNIDSSFDEIYVKYQHNRPVVSGNVDVSIKDWDGNGIVCNVLFEIYYSGDVKSVTIIRNKKLSYLSGFSEFNYPPSKMVVDLENKPMPYSFVYELHFTSGTNEIPIIVEDYHGNKIETKIMQTAQFVRQSSGIDIDIDNW